MEMDKAIKENIVFKNPQEAFKIKENSWDMEEKKYWKRVAEENKERYKKKIINNYLSNICY